MGRSTLSALLTVSLLATVAACATPPDAAPPGGPSGPDTRGTAPDQAAARAAVSALPASLITTFPDCPELLTYYQANALEQVGPYGLGGGGYGYPMDAGAVADDLASGAESAGPDPGAPEHSTTNVQEEGVDEADLVKTDGHIIATTIAGTVQIVQVASEQVISTVQIPGRAENVQPAELLLHDGTLVVLSSEWASWTPAADRVMAFPNPRTIVTTVDVSDPSTPRVLGSMRIEGQYSSARMIDGTIRMVMVTDPPGVEQTYPQDGRLTAEEEAEATNRQLILDTDIDAWIPHVQVLDADGEVTATQRLLDCEDIARPRDPAGLSTLSVLTFDVDAGTPQPTSGTGLIATGSTVYASTDRLIVATNRWDPWRWADAPAELWDPEAGSQTVLHSFDISDPDGTSYQASGVVDGYLLNQWALDEQDGVIRVATTTDPQAASQDSHSSLIMLTEDGTTLTETGRVDGLGRTEQIRAVRYLSQDLAAVVTFRQTDPLYLIDTSDPAAPRVTGELKIPGYSAYLHPLDSDTLLGVGQDADPETGRTHGMQVSLFDISDLSHPRQTQVLTWKDSTTAVEWDHRAFTAWPDTAQVFLPMNHWPQDGKDTPFAGVLVLDTSGAELTEQGRVPVTPRGQEEWGEGPSRTLVIGDDLWTLDYQGLARFDLQTLRGGWVVDL